MERTISSSTRKVIALSLVSYSVQANEVSGSDAAVLLLHLSCTPISTRWAATPCEMFCAAMNEEASDRPQEQLPLLSLWRGQSQLADGQPAAAEEIYQEPGNGRVGLE